MLDREFQRQVGEVTSRLAEQLEPDFPGAAAFMRRLGDAVQAEASEILDLYSSVTLWGGPGSVFDIGYADAAQEQERMRLLIDLVRLFESNGFHYQKARASAGIMRMWLRDWPAGD